MRKVTHQICSAFLDFENASIGNSSCSKDAILLHGHPIIQRRHDTYTLKMCGYGTMTTRERLNGFLTLLKEAYPSFMPHLGFFQAKGKQYVSYRSQWGAEVAEFPFDAENGLLAIDTRTQEISLWHVNGPTASRQRIQWKSQPV